LEHADLVAKRQDLHLKSSVGAKRGRQRGEEDRQDVEHQITRMGEEE
jgi:hypothetical protein